MNHCYRIPNELLKNSSYNFKQFLLVFLNKILEDGSVPEALNKGKCMLIFKVNYQKIFPKINQKCSSGWRLSSTISVQANHYPLQPPPPCDRENVWLDVLCS
jgi:hypothetical protein